MFDKITVRPHSVEHVPYEKTITVNNATTTEQARYLDELRTQARKDIVVNVHATVADNGLTVTHYSMYADNFNDKVIHRIAFKLNGKVYDFKVDFCHAELTVQANLDVIFEKVSAAIFGQIAPSLTQLRY